MSVNVPTEDLEGRVDLLAMRLMERFVRGSNDPQLTAWFQGTRPILEAFTADILGPIDVTPYIDRMKQMQVMAPIRKAPQGGPR